MLAIRRDAEKAVNIKLKAIKHIIEKLQDEASTLSQLSRKSLSTELSDAVEPIKSRVSDIKVASLNSKNTEPNKPRSPSTTPMTPRSFPKLKSNTHKSRMHIKVILSFNAKAKKNLQQKSLIEEAWRTSNIKPLRNTLISY